MFTGIERELHVSFWFWTEISGTNQSGQSPPLLSFYTYAFASSRRFHCGGKWKLNKASCYNVEWVVSILILLIKHIYDRMDRLKSTENDIRAWLKHHLLRLKWVACWSLGLARIWRALKFHVLKFESRSGLISTWCKSEAWNLSGGSFVREINVFDAMLSGSRLGDSSYGRIFVKCWFL